MTADQMTHLIRHTLLVALELSIPFLLLSLIVGIVVSVIQSLTQIQEMTLTFAPKIVVVALAIAILFPWMLKMMTKLTHNLLIFQWEKVTSCLNSTLYIF